MAMMKSYSDDPLNGLARLRLICDEHFMRCARWGEWIAHPLSSGEVTHAQSCDEAENAQLVSRILALLHGASIAAFASVVCQAWVVLFLRGRLR